METKVSILLLISTLLSPAQGQGQGRSRWRLAWPPSRGKLQVDALGHEHDARYTPRADQATLCCPAEREWPEESQASAAHASPFLVHADAMSVKGLHL